MANLREPLCGTAYASLEWSEERERAVDRVAASGKVPRLGLDLWKARYMLESQAYQDAHKTLVQAFRERYASETPEIAEKCVEEALAEFMGPQCGTCLGAREMIVGDLKVECIECNGSGLKVYTDFERSARMRISLHRLRLLGGKLRWLAGELGSLDRMVNMVLNDELRLIIPEA